jgi:hypothetical protein
MTTPDQKRAGRYFRASWTGEGARPHMGMSHTGMSLMGTNCYLINAAWVVATGISSPRKNLSFSFAFADFISGIAVNGFE